MYAWRLRPPLLWGVWQVIMSDFQYHLESKTFWPDDEGDNMIEIGEKLESGIRKVMQHGNHIGDIVKTDTKLWLAIPRRYGRNAPLTAHKLRRDAISAIEGRISR